MKRSTFYGNIHFLTASSQVIRWWRETKFYSGGQVEFNPRRAKILYSGMPLSVYAIKLCGIEGLVSAVQFIVFVF